MKRKTIDNFIACRKREGTYAWWYSKYSSVRREAKKKNRVFTISLDDYKLLRTNWKCYYCGSKDMFSVDRKNNEIGYIKENCVACCHRCNSMKSNILNEEETFAFVKVRKIIEKKHNKKVIVKITFGNGWHL